MASKEQELAIRIKGKIDSSLNSVLNAVGSGIKGVATTIAAASAASVAAVGTIATAAVNVGKEFETAMSQVSATMLIDKSTEEGLEAYNTLEEAARECGASTAFSATEAAEALNYLALAGYNAEQAATALPTVLNLAGAGAMDLATASDMVTDSMSALNIEATQDNLTEFADQMAMTASKANTSVSQLGEAILTVGATGANLAGGTNELNTALGILADNGVKSSEGGTHLRNVILALQSPTDAASAALSKYTSGVYDAEGNMRSLQDIFEELSDSMENMTQAEKDAVMNDIFNKTDLASANALLANSGDRWDELSEAIGNAAGACEEMYDIQLDNLEGDTAKFSSALSDLGISIYEDLNSPLREAVQLGTDMVGTLSTAYSSGGMSGMVAEVGTVLSQVIDVASEYLPMAVEIGIELVENLSQGIADNADKIGSAAAEIAGTFTEGIATLLPVVLLAGSDIIFGLMDGITAQLPELFTSGTESVTNFVNGFVERIPSMSASTLSLIRAIVEGITESAPELTSAGIVLIGSLATGLIQMLPEIAEMGMELLMGLAEAIIANIPLLIDTAVEIVNTLINTTITLLPELLTLGVELILAIIEGILENLPYIIQSAFGIVTSLISGIVTMLPALVETAIGLIESIAQGLIDNMPYILETGMEILLSLIEGIIQALPQLVMAIPQIIEMVVTLLLNSLPDFLLAGIQIIIALIQGLVTALPQLVTYLPSIIVTIVQSLLSGLGSLFQTGGDLLLSILQGIFESIPVLIAGVLTLPVEIIKALFTTDWKAVGTEFVTTLKDGIVEAATSFGSTIKNTVAGWFGGGDDTAEESGTEAAEQYASGITESSYLAADAAAELTTSTFSALDLTSVADAGTLTASTYTSGLDSTLSSYSLDTSALQIDTSSFNAAGRESTQTLAASISEGTDDIKTAASNMNTEAFSALDLTSATAAGEDTATAYTTGLTDTLSEVSLDEVTLSFSSAGTDGMTELEATIKNGTAAVEQATSALADGINSELNYGWKAVAKASETALGTLKTTTQLRVDKIASAIKYAFENLEITIPKPKIPEITVAYKTESYGASGSVKIPEFSVHWNALGGIFDSATVFNTSQGLQGAGEAGDEALIPLNTLWEKMEGLFATYSGASLIEGLIDRLANVGSSSKTTMEFAGTGGITYAPTFNITGSNLTQKDVEDAEQMSQERFAEMMETWQKQNRRKTF